MALITRIRKHFWFVLILLGLALASFIIMDIVNTNGGGGGRGSLTLGEINGQKINYNEFQNTENVYYNNSGTNTYSLKNTIWNYFIEKSIVEGEAEDLGLTVSQDELIDLQFGKDLSPIIEANWKNPETQQTDRTRLAEFKTAMDNGEFTNPRLRNFWAEQENQIKKAKLQDKLAKMVSKGIYTPKWMSDKSASIGKDQITLSYVKVPFDKMTESVSLSDEDYTSYMNMNKAKYEIDEESRVVETAVFDVLPTKSDSTKLFDLMTESKLAFQNSKNDSLYAVNNNGSYANFYFEAEKMPASIKDAITSLNTGETYGPYTENGAYNVVKLIDKKVIADSVHASHILRSADPANPASIIAARNHIDSVKTIILAGADFSDVAKTSSQDPGSGAKGGDLGYFAQGAMVPPFNEACFYDDADLHVVQTRFGVHLIKVHDRKFLDKNLKYKLSFIRNVIVPSQETQDRMYEDISNLLTNNTNIDALKEATKGMGVEFITAAPVKTNDYNFNNLGEGNVSRDIIRWAYQNDVSNGSIAPDVFTYADAVNYYNNKYVLTSLKQINSPGLPSVESMKSTLQTTVENNKKATTLVNSVGNDMNAIANKYGVKIDTAASVGFTSAFIAGMGTEPKVIAKAFNLNVGDAPVAVAGDNGLYIISVVEKTQGADVSGLAQFKNNDRNNKRREVDFGLMNAIKKELKVTDNRSTYF